MKMLREPLKKGDTVYRTNPTECGRFQSTVTLYCLPKEWAGARWAGELASTPQQAEQNAAVEATQKIQETPELASLVAMAEEFPRTKLDRMKQMRQRERQGRADRKAFKIQQAQEKAQAVLQLKAGAETDEPSRWSKSEAPF
jgi:hypothetical protein